jgi:LPPG:FO 2-phospho-L-lactate transferase
VYTVLAGGVGAARFLRGLTAGRPGRRGRRVVNVGDDLDLPRAADLPRPRLDHLLARRRRAPGAAVGSRRRDPRRRHGARTLRPRAVVHPRRPRPRRRTCTAPRLPRARAAVGGHRRGPVPSGSTCGCCRPPTTRSRPGSSPPTGATCTSRSTGSGSAAPPRSPGCGSPAPSDAEPAPGVVEAIRDAEAVLLAPSNPVVSIDTILAVPGHQGGPARPRTGRRGVPHRRRGGGPRYGAQAAAGRRRRGVRRRGRAPLRATLLDGWVIDHADADALGRRVRRSASGCVVTDTMMDDVEVAAALARTCLDLAASVRTRGEPMSVASVEVVPLPTPTACSPATTSPLCCSTRSPIAVSGCVTATSCASRRRS